MKNRLKLWLLVLIGLVSLIGLICGGLSILGGMRLFHISYEAQGQLLMGSMWLICLSVTLFVLAYVKIKYPKEYEKDLMEQSDERSVFIKYRAGYKAGQIVLYMNFALMFLKTFHLIDDVWISFSSYFSVILYLALRMTFYYNKYYEE